MVPTLRPVVNQHFTAPADSLKALDLDRPIREADIDQVAVADAHTYNDETGKVKEGTSVLCL
jgi:hypothetical protein